MAPVYDDIHNSLASLDGGNVVLDFVDPDGSGTQPMTLAKRYLYGEAVDQILAQEDVTKTLGDASRTLWPLVDNLGSVRDLAKQDGTIAVHYIYDTYGNVTSGDTSLTRYLFTSRKLDTATDLQYNRARWYDAEVGRWISEDPIGFAAGDANLYRYVSNSPTNKIDPDGLEEQDLDAWRQQLRAAYEQAMREAAAQQQAEPPITRVPGVFGNSVHLNDGYFAGSPFGIPTVVCHGVTGTGRVGPPNSFRFPGGPGQLQNYQALRDTTASGVAGVGIGAGAYGGTAIGGPLVAQGGRAATARLMALLATRGREAIFLGSLTANQIQGLIASSGDRAVTLFTRLSQSPVANRALYTATNPNLCNQIRHAAGKTQLYAGRIPHDLFQRLRFDGFIRVEQTQMGNVVDKAYMISAEAMPLLQQYFEQTGGDGIP